ncbi:hypothetical protein ACFHW1_05105 [Micromonospora sp. LOL_014]|uniref:hypothetical protein n=1 Tax=Micromonospora sp. LOL_014 TaxID=3345415 RepID=UPI003A870576
MSAPRVVGLDLSLASTGIAVGHWTFSIKPGDRRDLARLEYLRDAVLAYVIDNSPDLVVVEGPSYGSARGAQAGHHERAGLWWLVRMAITGGAGGWPLAVVPPATLKLYATGKGTADKPAMAVAAYKRLGIEGVSDDEVDAAWLRAAGMDHLGHPLAVMPAAQRAALDKVTWPEVTR